MAQETIKNGVLIKYQLDAKQESATISDAVTRIGKNTFDDCTRLTSITVPATIHLQLLHHFVSFNWTDKNKVVAIRN